MKPIKDPEQKVESQWHECVTRGGQFRSSVFTLVFCYRGALVKTNNRLNINGFRVILVEDPPCQK